MQQVPYQTVSVLIYQLTNLVHDGFIQEENVSNLLVQYVVPSENVLEVSFALVCFVNVFEFLDFVYVFLLVPGELVEFCIFDLAKIFMRNSFWSSEHRMVNVLFPYSNEQVGFVEYMVIIKLDVFEIDIFLFTYHLHLKVILRKQTVQII